MADEIFKDHTCVWFQSSLARVNPTVYFSSPNYMLHSIKGPARLPAGFPLFSLSSLSLFSAKQQRRQLLFSLQFPLKFSHLLLLIVADPELFCLYPPLLTLGDLWSVTSSSTAAEGVVGDCSSKERGEIILGFWNCSFFSIKKLISHLIERQLVLDGSSKKVTCYSIEFS